MNPSIKSRGRAPSICRILEARVMPAQLAAHNEVMLEVGQVVSKWRHRFARAGLNALETAGAGFDNDLHRAPGKETER